MLQSGNRVRQHRGGPAICSGTPSVCLMSFGLWSSSLHIPSPVKAPGYGSGGMVTEGDSLGLASAPQAQGWAL